MKNKILTSLLLGSLTISNLFASSETINLSVINDEVLTVNLTDKGTGTNDSFTLGTENTDNGITVNGADIVFRNLTSGTNNVSLGLDSVTNGDSSFKLGVTTTPLVNGAHTVPLTVTVINIADETKKLVNAGNPVYGPQTIFNSSDSSTTMDISFENAEKAGTYSGGSVNYTITKL